MHMICTNACKNAMNACTCVFITGLSMLCFNYTHTISFMLLAHMVHVNACMNAMARRPQLWHFPYVKKGNRTSNWSCAAVQRSPSGPPFFDAGR